MDLLPLAAAQELVFLGAALAVALLLAFQLRLAQRFRTLDLEVQRLNKAHKDGTLDARSRLEEATKSLEALEESVTPKLAALEPHLFDAAARLDELEERVAALAPALEAAGRREAQSSEVLEDARSRLEQAEAEARTVGERFGVVEEGVRDAANRLEQAEGGLDRLRSTLDERLDELVRRVGALESVPASAPREPTRAALGLAERRAARAAVGTGADDEDGTGEAGTAEVAREAEPAATDSTASEDVHEDLSVGMRGLLIGVIALAVLTVLLHLMGVGR